MPEPDAKHFPWNVAVALEGESPFDSDSALQSLRTLELRPFKEALQLVRSYILNYTADQGRTTGVVMGISGAHGAGKTHLARFLSTHAEELASDDSNDKLRLTQIYVKCESDDFLALFRRIMPQVDYETLRSVNTTWISLIAQREASKGIAETEVGKRPSIGQHVSSILKEDPRTVYNFLRSGLISSTTVESEHLRWVKTLTQYEDFLAAVSYLPDPLLGQEAYRWFLGEELPAATLSRLGIGRSIDNPDMAKAALRFVATVFGYAGQLFLLYIDQIERLILDASPDSASVNKGILHTLTEVFRQAGAYLCLIGVTEAWEAMPLDLLARLTYRPIELPYLTMADALNLVKLYLCGEQDSTPYRKQDEIFPYSESAIKEMVVFSHGNIRRFLNLAYQTFEDASTTQGAIGVTEVRAAAQRVGEHFDQDTITTEIKSLLQRANLQFDTPTGLRGRSTPSLSVLREDTPVALISISTALFSTDEAQKALKYINSVKGTLEEYPHVRLILVVAGYASHEVRDLLGQVVNHYMVYDPVTFPREFMLLLNEIKTDSQTTAETASREMPGSGRPIEAQLEELRVSILETLSRRQAEDRMLEVRLDSFIAQRTAADDQRRTEQSRLFRLSLEQQEQSRVEQARTQREFNEQNERELLRTQGEAIRRRKLVIRLIPGALVIVMILLVYATTILRPELLYELFRLYDTTIAAFLIIALIPLGIIFVYSLYIDGYFNQDISSARGPVANLRTLDELALRLIRQGRSTHVYMRRILRDPNPQVRYIAALILADTSTPYANTQGLLIYALKNETWIHGKRVIISAILKPFLDEHFERYWRDTDRIIPLEVLKVFDGLLHELETSTDRESLYLTDALISMLPPSASSDQVTEYLRGKRLTRLLRNIGRRPIYVQVDFMISAARRNLDLEPVQEVDALNDQSISEHVSELRFADAVATCIRLPDQSIHMSNPEQEIYELAALCLRDQNASSDFLNHIRQEGLMVLTPETVQNLIELFGLRNEQSLGYYEGLRNARLYNRIYSNLFQVWLAVQEFRYSRP